MVLDGARLVLQRVDQPGEVPRAELARRGGAALRLAQLVTDGLGVVQDFALVGERRARRIRTLGVRGRLGIRRRGYLTRGYRGHAGASFSGAAASASGERSFSRIVDEMSTGAGTSLDSPAGATAGAAGPLVAAARCA